MIGLEVFFFFIPLTFVEFWCFVSISAASKCFSHISEPWRVLQSKLGRTDKPVSEYFKTLACLLFNFHVDITNLVKK